MRKNKRDDRDRLEAVPDGTLKDANPLRRSLSFLKPWVHKSSSSASLNSLVEETPLIYSKWKEKIEGGIKLTK
jgi:hypothetical protein